MGIQIELFNSEVSLKLINLAWYSSNQDDNKIRYELTKKGIETFYQNITRLVSYKIDNSKKIHIPINVVSSNLTEDELENTEKSRLTIMA